MMKAIFFLSSLLTINGFSTELAAPVQLKSDGEVIDIGASSYAGPLYGDINGDGKPDLFVTSIRGIFIPFININKEEDGVPILSTKKRLSESRIPPQLQNW